MKASQFTDHEQRITRLEVVNEQIFKSLERLEKKMDSIETDMKNGFKEVNSRFDAVNNRFDTMNGRFELVNGRLWTNFLWILTLYLGGYGSLLAIIAKGFHWY